jgi:hypothetical protein
MSDVDRALDRAIAFAKQMVSQRGAFVPFAAVVDREGVAIAQLPGKPSDDPSVMLDVLVRSLRQRRGELWAVAVASNRRDRQLGDVVHVAVEHRNGPAAVVVVPYSAKRKGRTVRFGEPQRLPGAPLVWANE